MIQIDPSPRVAVPINYRGYKIRMLEPGRFYFREAGEVVGYLAATLDDCFEDIDMLEDGFDA